MRKLKLPPLWENPSAKADQLRFIRSPKRISIAATGSKTGKTVGCAIWVVEQMSKLPPGALIWWVAPYWRTTKIGFERVKQLLPPEWRKVNESEMTITGTNGVRIEFRSAENPDTLFGEAVHACVVDEGARMRERAWEAIQTTMMQTGGPIRIAGNTDRGRNNWFYRLYDAGRSGRAKDVDSWSIKTYDNPHMKYDDIMALKSKYTKRAWDSLIEAEFTDDAAAVFRNVRECVIPAPPNARVDYLAEPYDKNHAYTVGADLGKHEDFTVLTGFDIIDRRVVHWERTNNRSWDVHLGLAKAVSEKFNQAPIWFDSTGAGEPLFMQMQKMGANVQGFKFSNQSKEMLIERLILGLEQRDILIPANLETLIAELEGYEVEISEHGNFKYSSPGGDLHDDAVISLALAYWNTTASYEVGYSSAQRIEQRFAEPPPTDPDAWLRPSNEFNNPSSLIQVSGGRWGADTRGRGGRRWE